MSACKRPTRNPVCAPLRCKWCMCRNVATRHVLKRTVTSPQAWCVTELYVSDGQLRQKGTQKGTTRDQVHSLARCMKIFNKTQHKCLFFQWQKSKLHCTLTCDLVFLNVNMSPFISVISRFCRWFIVSINSLIINNKFIWMP